VTAYRRLAGAHPDAFTPDLAKSLINLSNALAALGRREDAITADQEARAVAGQTDAMFTLWVLFKDSDPAQARTWLQLLAATLSAHGSAA
jgi:hypothetical protein